MLSRSGFSPVRAGVVTCIVLPWIWPFATGPWSAAQQAIISLACAGVLLLCLAAKYVGLAQAVATSWLLAAGISSLLGLAQYFGLSPYFQPWMNVTGLGDAFGNLRQRNQFATLTNLGLAVLLWSPAKGHVMAQGVAQADGAHAGHWLPARVFLLALLFSVANAASGSRTGLLQLVALVALAVFWDRGFRQPTGRILAVAGLGYLAAALLLPLLIGLNPAENGIGARLRATGLVCASRWVLWTNVLQLIAERPWSGWGWGELDYAHFMAEYSGPRFCEILDNAHNLPLHLAVELGLPLALAVCALGLYFLWRGKPWREQSATRRMGWAALALILLHSMLEYPLWYGPFQLAFATAALLLLPARARKPELAMDAGLPGPLRLPALVIGVVAISASAFAAWDYWRVSQMYLAPEARARAYMSNTLEKISDSWLFANQVRFAELATTDLTTGNAARMAALSEELLHFSPESRVVEKRIESALLLGQEEEAQSYIARYKSVYPKDYATWAHLRLLSDPANPVQNGPQAP